MKRLQLRFTRAIYFAVLAQACSHIKQTCHGQGSGCWKPGLVAMPILTKSCEISKLKTDWATSNALSSFSGRSRSHHVAPRTRPWNVMSTLTSAQLHVKRSSTRLHAPPGGASSLSFGCGGFGTAEPAEEAPSKDDPAYTRPSSGRYVPPTSRFNNTNSNAPGGYPSYSAPQPDPAPYNNYAPPQQTYQQQTYQHQVPYNASGQNSFNYGNTNANYAGNNNGRQAGRPPSSTSSSRSSARSSWSSMSWGSQPPLTSSKRDQNWEKKRRLWLARKNSNNGSNYGDRPPTSSLTWSSDQPEGMLDDSINPPSPLSKLMHQHAQQQQPPPTPGVDYQRLGTASSARSSSGGGYTQQPYPQQPYQAQTQAPYPAGVSFSRAGLSTASSTASSTTSSRRQPPGGQCQWSLG